MSAFTPASISNISWHFEPALGGMFTTFTGTAGTATPVGAGATPVTTTGDFIGFLPDNSGNGYNAAGQPTAGVDYPTYQSAAFNGLPCARFNGTTSRFNFGKPANLEALRYQSFTAFFVYKETAGNAYGAILAKATSDSRTLWVSTQANLALRNFIRFQYACADPAKYSTPINAPVMVTYRMSLIADQESSTDWIMGREEIFYNGLKVVDRVGGLSNVVWNSTNSWAFGATDTGTFPMQGDVAANIAFGRALSDTELDQMHNYLAKFGVVAGKFNNLLTKNTPSVMNAIITGNSLIAGVQDYGRDVVTQLEDSLRTYPMTFFNAGVGGIQTTVVTSNASIREDTLTIPGLNNTLAMFEITNELSSNLNGTTSWNDYTAYFDGRAGKYSYRIALTCLPRGAVAAFETQRQILRGLALADSPTQIATNIYTGSTHFDYLIDIGGDATIGVPGAQNNATYYASDLTHLVPVGTAILASYISTVLLLIYNKTISRNVFSQQDFNNFVSTFMVTPANKLATNSSGQVVASSVAGNVTGSVGSIANAPTNFSTLSVDGSGRILLQPAQPGVTIPTVTTLTSVPSNFTSLAISSSGQVQTQYPLQTNIAYNNFTFYAVSSTDHITPAIGLTFTGQKSLNGGAFASLNNAATEIGLGWYKVNLAAGDLNGIDVALRFTATGADTVNIKLALAA